MTATSVTVNAGGLINVAAELEPGGYKRAAVKKKIDAIPETLTAIFERAKRESRPTNDVALEMALQRIRQARRKTV